MGEQRAERREGDNVRGGRDRLGMKTPLCFCFQDGLYNLC